MSILLETIKDALKDVHIEDGTNDSFDRVCEMLENKIKDSHASIYALGIKNGEKQCKENILTLLGVYDLIEEVKGDL